MFNTKKIAFASLSVAALLMVGCDDKVKVKAEPAAKTVSGTAIDGYLVGSAVSCAATGEEATTDKNGRFAFSKACTDLITVERGDNTAIADPSDVISPFMGQLKALAGSTVVTPLTTLQAATAPYGVTVDELLMMLNLEPGTDIGKIDPIASPGENLKLLKTTAAVQQVVQDIAKTLYFEGYTKNGYALAMEQLANSVILYKVAPLFNAAGKINTNGPVLDAMDSIARENNLDPGLVDGLVVSLNKRLQAIFGAADKQALSKLLAEIQRPGQLDGDAKSLQEDPRYHASLSGENIKFSGVVDLDDIMDGDILNLDKVKARGFEAKGSELDENFTLTIRPNIGLEMKYEGKKTSLAAELVGYQYIDLNEITDFSDRIEHCNSVEELTTEEFDQLPEDSKKQYNAYCQNFDESVVEVERRIEVYIKDVIIDVDGNRLSIDEDAPGQKDAVAYVYLERAETEPNVSLFIKDPVSRARDEYGEPLIGTAPDGDITINYNRIKRALSEAIKEIEKESGKTDITAESLMNLRGDFVYSVAVEDLNIRQADGSAFDVISLNLKNIKGVENASVNGYGIRNGKITITD